MAMFNFSRNNDNNQGYVTGSNKDLWSTGNRAKDYLSGLAIGIPNSMGTNRKGNFYVNSNWAGNGLANSRLGYISNDRYQNPYDQAALLKSMLSNDKTRNGGGWNLSGALGKLGGLLNKSNGQGSIFPIQQTNTLSDFIGNEATGTSLNPESLSDYIGMETNYGGYVPQFLPSSFDNIGDFYSTGLS